MTLTEIRFAVISAFSKGEMLNQSHVGKQHHLGGVRPHLGLHSSIRGKGETVHKGTV